MLGPVHDVGCQKGSMGGRCLDAIAWLTLRFWPWLFWWIGQSVGFIPATTYRFPASGGSEYYAGAPLSTGYCVPLVWCGREYFHVTHLTNNQRRWRVHLPYTVTSTPLPEIQIASCAACYSLRGLVHKFGDVSRRHHIHVCSTPPAAPNQIPPFWAKKPHKHSCTFSPSFPWVLEVT